MPTLPDLAQQFANRTAYQAKLEGVIKNNLNHLSPDGVKHHKKLLSHSQYALSNLRSQIVTLLWAAT